MHRFADKLSVYDLKKQRGSIQSLLVFGGVNPVQITTIGFLLYFYWHQFWCYFISSGIPVESASATEPSAHINQTDLRLHFISIRQHKIRFTHQT